MSEIWVKGLEDPSSLSEIRAQRFDYTLSILVAYLQQAEELQAVGTLSSELAHTRDTQLQWLVTKPGIQAHVKKWIEMYPPRFRKRVEELMQCNGKA